jgi:drug/metabolite transporter (DMT)-like permease
MRLTVAGSRQSAFGPIDWALLVGTSLIWGTSFLWIKLAVEAFKPGLVALLRVTLGFVAILLMLIVLHRGNMNQVAADFRFVWGPNHRLRVILLGIGWMGGPFMLLAIAAQYIDSSLSGMLIGAMPLMVAVIASISLRKLPGGKQQIGLVIGFAGVVMIVMADMASLTSADDAVNATSAATASTAATAATASTAAVSASTEVPASSVALGIVLCLLCALSFSLCATAAVPLQQKMTKRAGPFGFLPVVASMQFVSILICLPYGILDGLRAKFDWIALLAILLLGTISTGAGYMCMAALGGRVGPVRGAIPIYFLPVVSIVAGVIGRSERVAPLAIVGTAFVSVGAIFASRREAPHVVASGQQAVSQVQVDQGAVGAAEMPASNRK